MDSIRRCAVVAVVSIAGFWASSDARAALPPQAESCSMCHTGEAGGPPKLRLDGFAASAHGSLECAACHAGAGEMPHETPLPKVDCGACHADALRGLKSSPHGKAMLKRGGGGFVNACLRCHGGTPHSIKKVADAASPAAHGNQVQLCGSCHDKPDQTPKRIERLKPVESYLKTVHGLANANGSRKAAVCADCHGSHDIRSGIDSASKVSRNRISETCGRCHEQEATVYSRSVHGRARAEGVRESPTCTDCHGEHDVVSVASAESKVSSAAVSGTCARCHASARIVGKFGLKADRVSTFAESYHGLAAERGAKKAANCASCHGWHEILPPEDAASTINPANLPKTCGACHPGAGGSFGGTQVHTGLSNKADASEVAQWVRWFYAFLIPMVIGGMLFHNGVDLFRKSVAGPSLKPLKEHPSEPLLSVSERFQHAGLALSFIVLALTGFALEYPDFCATDGCLLIGSEAGRRWTHRGAAILFSIVGVWHAGYLLLSARGRQRLWALLPAMRDAFDPPLVMLSNLGFKVKRPVLPRWSYIEKAEYWALIWGSFVMLVTGAVLAFENLSLEYLPLWAIEASQVIHFLEAVLACLAILVWHWYWAIFDPHVYPMNWAWLTGWEKWGEKGHDGSSKSKSKESGHEEA